MESTDLSELTNRADDNQIEQDTLFCCFCCFFNA